MNEKTNGSEKVEDLIIVGGGPAGYTAALYAARAELEPLVIEGFQWGGQLQNTTDVENYPGYHEGVMGPEMMNEFRAQAERFGTRFITDDATELELSDGEVQTVKVGKDTYRAKAVILSMGAEPKRLGIPGEIELAGQRRLHLRRLRRRLLQGRGRRRDRRRRLGDGGLDLRLQVRQEAVSIHRRDEFRASKIMQERARGKDNIEFLTPYVPVEFVAGDDGKIAKITLEHAETGEAKELDVGGAFVAIGHRPRSELVKGQVETDEEGYVVVEEPSTKTNLAGVFAVGDLVDHTYRQAVTAAGSGTKGALDAEWYLRDMPPDPEEHWGTNTGAIIEAVEAS